jgi:hypothetical protein
VATGAVRRRRRYGLSLSVLLVVGLVAAGVAVELTTRDGYTGRASVATPPPQQHSAAPATGPFTPGNLVLEDRPAPDGITVSWTDPSGGTATPVLSLSTASGQTIAVVTLAPGTTVYSRRGLDPAADYCALVALYPTATDTTALAARACTHRN